MTPASDESEHRKERTNMAPANNRGYNNVGPPHSAPRRPPPGALSGAAVKEAWVHPARATSVDSSSSMADVEWGGGSGGAAMEVGRFEFESGGRTPMARYSNGGGGHYRYHMAENGHHQLRARDVNEIRNFANYS